MARPPQIKVSITERDLGLKRILEIATDLKRKPFVKVGVTQARGSRLREDGKYTVAEIAQVHEFGTEDGRIPERSWLRSTIAAHQDYDSLRDQLSENLFDASKNKNLNVDKALRIMGEKISSDMKATIRAGIAPALSERTIQKKTKGRGGKSVPLIDTGQMINSISYEVHKDGREGVK